LKQVKAKPGSVGRRWTVATLLPPPQQTDRGGGAAAGKNTGEHLSMPFSSAFDPFFLFAEIRVLDLVACTIDS
jgi:hypothetical protein